MIIDQEKYKYLNVSLISDINSYYSVIIESFMGDYGKLSMPNFNSIIDPYRQAITFVRVFTSNVALLKS